MNKKVNKSALKNNCYEEDLEITKVAYMQNPAQNILLYVLSLKKIMDFFLVLTLLNILRSTPSNNSAYKKWV